MGRGAFSFSSSLNSGIVVVGDDESDDVENSCSEDAFESTRNNG